MLKRLIKLSSFFLVISCASIETNRIAPGYAEAFEAFKNLIFGYENPISSDLINTIPYASSLLRIGNGPFGLLILEKKEGEVETWVSADGVLLQIERGRIIKTSGLQHNLIDFIMPDELMNFSKSEEIFITSYLSFDNPQLSNLPVQSSFQDKGFRMVKLMNGKKNLKLVEEEIINIQLGWKVLNRYWLDENGFIWKSDQFISPRLPKFEIEVTKKPS